MKNKNKKVTPVLLGGDLNAYSMALSFAKAEGVASHCFARGRLAICDLSSFVNLHVVPELDDCNVAVPELIRFATEHSEERLILVPCADWYLEMLEYARDKLSKYYFFHIPKFEVWRAVSDKASFIKILDKYGISHPKTEIFDRKMKGLFERGASMKPPFVLKPSDSSEYWRNKFEGMKKVYILHTLGEVRDIAAQIYASGYGGKLLLQEFIGNGGGARAADASVLTVYMNKNAKAVCAVLGDVLLEESGDTSRGNYSAIVTRRLDEVSKKLIFMLEQIGYTGIANFDILRADGNSYCLELNARQGRSFDYVRSVGVSLAQLLVCELSGERAEERFNYNDAFWRCVSRRTVAKYSTNRPLLKKAQRLQRQGACITPYDSFGNRQLRHSLYVLAHMYRENKRYSKRARTV